MEFYCTFKGNVADILLDLCSSLAIGYMIFQHFYLTQEGKNTLSSNYAEIKAYRANKNDSYFSYSKISKIPVKACGC